MIISCASVLESPRRGASNTLSYDFIIEPLVIKEKPHYYDLVYKVVVGGPAMAGTFLAENGFGRTSFSSDYIFFYF